MKYVVEAIIDFDDYNGKEINGKNKYVKRKEGDVFEVNKKRCEYLLEHQAIIVLEVKKNNE